MTTMTYKRALSMFACTLAMVLIVVPVFAQGGRGKAELKAGSGSITVDYGRPPLSGPTLQGKDPLAFQKEGSFWRMGKDTSTTFTTPVDLTFGDTKIAKGSYSIWLLKESADAYKLVFNSQTGQWGTQHDKSKDVAQAAMKKATAPSSVDLFTIDLKEAAKGGTFILTWGTAQLTADFQFSK
jgi:hypothetical protein